MENYPGYGPTWLRKFSTYHINLAGHTRNSARNHPKSPKHTAGARTVVPETSGIIIWPLILLCNDLNTIVSFKQTLLRVMTLGEGK